MAVTAALLKDPFTIEPLGWNIENDSMTFRGAVQILVADEAKLKMELDDK